MQIHRTGTAEWKGGLKDGVGALTTQSGALNAAPYGFASRFEGVKGSNPEELLGAAHAGCFTMAMSLALGEAGFKADVMTTVATVTLDQSPAGVSIPAIGLALTARVPGLDDARFQAIAAGAKMNCPLSKVLRADITLEAELLPD